MKKSPANSTVVVLGASTNPERYSYLAVRMLVENGYAVIPINPAKPTIAGISSRADLSEVSEIVDTITVYVNASISEPLLPSILRVKPRRIIFNPGAENPALADSLRKDGIEVVEACTLVMLRTGQF